MYMCMCVCVFTVVPFCFKWLSYWLLYALHRTRTQRTHLTEMGSEKNENDFGSKTKSHNEKTKIVRIQNEFFYRTFPLFIFFRMHMCMLYTNATRFQSVWFQLSTQHNSASFFLSFVEFYDQHLLFIRVSYDRSYKRSFCYAVAFMRIYEL